MAATPPLPQPNRPHSSSVSSVHFALPPRRLPSLGSGLAYETIPAPRSADDPYSASGDSGSPVQSTFPPTTYPNPPTSDRRASAASVLKGGKRASVVTGGFESSSDDEGSRVSVARPRATTIALPTSTSPSEVQRLSASRHSSRDILRASVLRPIPSSSSSPRSLVSPSKSARRDASPSKRKGKARAEISWRVAWGWQARPVDLLLHLVRQLLIVLI
jgi:hypothetical protein